MLVQRSRGRPLGSTKSASAKAKEATDFRNEVEKAIEALLLAKGEFPTKTAVAKELGLGGLSARTGVDSSLSVFNKKLRRLGLDYNTIVKK
jgi:hypothetical protein